jgi:hypothetical protein
VGKSERAMTNWSRRRSDIDRGCRRQHKANVSKYLSWKQRIGTSGGVVVVEKAEMHFQGCLTTQQSTLVMVSADDQVRRRLMLEVTGWPASASVQYEKRLENVLLSGCGEEGAETREVMVSSGVECAMIVWWPVGSLVIDLTWGCWS